MTQQKKLAWLTVVFWILLLYIVAALVWWFIALNRQADEMSRLRLAQVAPHEAGYTRHLAEIQTFRQRKHAQYIGEGSIFFLVIVAGAVFVYRAARRQINLASQQQNFMMAVTHELKTPIAITRLNLETLRKHKLDAERQQKLLQTALQETERLNDLTSNILLASRIDGGMDQFFAEEVDLGTLVGEVVRQFQTRYPARRFVYAARENGITHGDSLQLKLLVSNLLENAVKYTPADKPVTIGIEPVRAAWVISVADLGPGVLPEDRDRIFEKFFRSGSEDTRQTKGTGLGLYLCRKIAQAHGGNIEVTENVPQGALFRVTIPRR